jgi:sporulation protein YlmC with PRC-barrel domain
MATLALSLAPNHRAIATSALKGARVRNFAGEDLGKVDDLILDLHSGRTTYVVISLGGFLGIGDRLYAVPWELFSVRRGEPQLFVDLDKAVLADAPSFDRARWPDMSEETWIQDIQLHYAQKPYWNSDFTDAGDYVGDDRFDKSDRDRI